MSHGVNPAASVSTEAEFRDIHPLSNPVPESWDAGSTRSSLPAPSEDQYLMTMSREFSALVAAGNADQAAAAEGGQLGRIGEDDQYDHDVEETNPLAIVPDGGGPMRGPSAGSPGRQSATLGEMMVRRDPQEAEAVYSVRQVRKEEVEAKVGAWEAAEIAKINNRWKREEVMLTGWEKEQLEKATAWLRKIERKLEEQRAKAREKAENEMAKAKQKAEEKRASSEAKRGLKTAKVMELASFMKAVGRVPNNKRSFF